MSSFRNTPPLGDSKKINTNQCKLQGPGLVPGVPLRSPQCRPTTELLHSDLILDETTKNHHCKVKRLGFVPGAAPGFPDVVLPLDRSPGAPSWPVPASSSLPSSSSLSPSLPLLSSSLLPSSLSSSPLLPSADCPAAASSSEPAKQWLRVEDQGFQSSQQGSDPAFTAHM